MLACGVVFLSDILVINRQVGVLVERAGLRGGMSAFDRGLILNNGVLYDKGHYKGV